MPISREPDLTPIPTADGTRLVDRVVAEGKRRRRRSAVLAGGLAALVLLALAVPLAVHLSGGGHSTVGLMARGSGATGADTTPTATGEPSSTLGGPVPTAGTEPTSPNRDGPTVLFGPTTTAPLPHPPSRPVTTVTVAPPAGTGNAGLTVHVTAAATGNLRAHVHVVADDPDHTLPAVHWGPACSGWSVDFGEAGMQIACPAICEAGSATPAPPPSPGHVDAAVDHAYPQAGTYTVTVRYVVMCGAAASDPTLSGGVATATVTVT